MGFKGESGIFEGSCGPLLAILVLYVIQTHCTNDRKVSQAKLPQISTEIPFKASIKSFCFFKIKRNFFTLIF